MNNQPTRNYIEELSYKLKSGTITPKEYETFEKWYQLQHQKDVELPTSYASNVDELKNRMYNRITERIEVKKNVFSLRKWLNVAAAILCVFAAGGYLWLSKGKQSTEVSKTLVEDFAPGSNKAVLTLAGGQQILLSDAKEGHLASQGSINIEKTSDGEVVYTGKGKELMLNTMSTPKGGEYRLRLADGTNVWLNAASSITYPSVFSGKNREVEITGEVYFEVAHQADKPFMVKSKGQVIEVLGTHFNVNAYDDEETIKTTLLEGSVKISGSGLSKLLKPGQVAILHKNGINVENTDVHNAVAWKEGYFEFIESDIRTIMNQLGRWYNVEVEFEGPITRETFTGRISKFRNISQVLNIIKESNSVTLTFKGRRIMVK